MDGMTWLQALAAVPIGIGRLLWYFQAPGLLSILGWVLALVLLVAFYRRRRRRHVAYAFALGLALMGAGFGKLNSLSISKIRTDMTDKLNAARATQEEASQRQVAERRQLGLLEDIHFAEDDTQDVEERQKQVDAKKSIYELASEGKTNQVAKREAGIEAGQSAEYEQWSAASQRPTAPPARVTDPGNGAAPASWAGIAEEAPPVDDEAVLSKFDYRKGGKKERAAGSREKDSVIRQAMKQEEAVGGRLMKEPDVLRAQRFDRINLFFCRNTLWLAVLMLLADYLFRANRTFWTVWPLPVTGRLLDAFFPKRHAVLMEPDAPVFLKGYLETAVRKGETFLYLGESDPWRAPAVLRWRIPSLPELFLRLPGALVALAECAGLHIARAYRWLKAGWQRRASGEASRGSLAVRAGDRLLDWVDAAVRRLGPPVSRGAVAVWRRLYAGALEVRWVWVTAQARYPLRLAPVALLLFLGHWVSRMWARARGRRGGAAADGSLPAGEPAPARLPFCRTLAERAKILGCGCARVCVRLYDRLTFPAGGGEASARTSLRRALAEALRALGRGCARALTRLHAWWSAGGGRAVWVRVRRALAEALQALGRGCARVCTRLYDWLTLPTGGDVSAARLPLRQALAERARILGRGCARSCARLRDRLTSPDDDEEPFLLGRVDPQRLGRRRWWDGQVPGRAVELVRREYRAYADVHPRWREWLERLQAHLRRLDAVLFREGLWGWVARLSYDRASLPADRLFPFEAVWFNRYCCCIVGRDAVQAALPDLLHFLKFRLVPRARAWQTVNLVWDLDLPLDRETLDELVFRCRESNLRLMVVPRGGWAQAGADLFDEKASEEVGADDRARIERMAVLADRIAVQRGWAT